MDLIGDLWHPNSRCHRGNLLRQWNKIFRHGRTVITQAKPSLEAPDSLVGHGRRAVTRTERVQETWGYVVSSRIGFNVKVIN